VTEASYAGAAAGHHGEPARERVHSPDATCAAPRQRAPGCVVLMTRKRLLLLQVALFNASSEERRAALIVTAGI
jgi:hypothetical protein